jgi:hypothetical protein
LGVKNEEELIKYFLKFKEITPSVIFYEPDYNNQATSICLYGTMGVRKKLKHLPLLGKKKETFEDVILKMSQTKQFESQSVLEHGLSVFDYFQKMTQMIDNNSFDDEQIKMPLHMRDKKLLDNLVDGNILYPYLVFHDIGKPYCRVWDESNNKFSFPNHAQVSHDKFLEISENKNKEQIAKLILHDMDFHLLKPSSVEDFMKNTDLSKEQIITLLYACLSELNSNSRMFGGFDSVSFKIKYKNFEKISKKILDILMEK